MKASQKIWTKKKQNEWKVIVEKSKKYLAIGIQYIPPKWCSLPLDSHFDGMSGCWGMPYMYAQGYEYCKDCEYVDKDLKIILDKMLKRKKNGKRN